MPQLVAAQTHSHSLSPSLPLTSYVLLLDTRPGLLPIVGPADSGWRGIQDDETAPPERLQTKHRPDELCISSTGRLLRPGF